MVKMREAYRRVEIEKETVLKVVSDTLSQRGDLEDQYIGQHSVMHHYCIGSSMKPVPRYPRSHTLKGLHLKLVLFVVGVGGSSPLVACSIAELVAVRRSEVVEHGGATRA